VGDGVKLGLDVWKEMLEKVRKVSSTKAYVTNGVTTRVTVMTKSYFRSTLNSMAFSPQANYTDRATAACRRN
jgi:hypothetical protein